MPGVNPYLPASLQIRPRALGLSVRGPNGPGPGTPRARRGPARRALAAAWGVVAAAGFTASLVILLRMMLQVTSDGGFCARGGAYVIAHECSAQAAALTPLSILGLLVFTGIGAAARGVGLAVVALAWPALFCTLGGGFVYSARYPAFGAGTAYLVGGMFIAMGAGPLLMAVFAAVARWRRRTGEAAAESPDGIPAVVRRLTAAVLLAAGTVAGWYAAGWLLGLGQAGTTG